MHYESRQNKILGVDVTRIVIGAQQLKLIFLNSETRLYLDQVGLKQFYGNCNKNRNKNGYIKEY